MLFFTYLLPCYCTQDCLASHWLASSLLCYLSSRTSFPLYQLLSFLVTTQSFQEFIICRLELLFCLLCQSFLIFYQPDGFRVQVMFYYINIVISIFLRFDLNFSSNLYRYDMVPSLYTSQSLYSLFSLMQQLQMFIFLQNINLKTLRAELSLDASPVR